MRLNNLILQILSDAAPEGLTLTKIYMILRQQNFTNLTRTKIKNVIKIQLNHDIILSKEKINNQEIEKYKIRL